MTSSQRLPQIGVFLPSMTAPGQTPGDMRAAARHLEDLGFESAWVVDQLVAGTGVPFLDSTIVLATAAAVTSRIRLGFGVMIVPLHPVVWVAKQVASLQQASADRIILGVGAGGDRHQLAWQAARVPRGERGRRTDDALRLLPGLIGGQPTPLGDAMVQLAPGANVPEILVGGMSDAAMRRAVDHADGWFLLPALPAAVAGYAARLGDLAASRGRPRPTITAAISTALTPDSSLPSEDALARQLADPDGMFGIPPEAIRSMLVRGAPAALAELVAPYAEAGADRLVISVAGGDWFRQTELIARALMR
jgi:alkanesulfonate monooxygenase SsuD/methylene tetrahydromethanopterin reductase-like flavin-dependent oxidoreductase (luciferase family)